MSRIQGVIDQLERGEELTRQKLRQLLRLQALDLAREGELFVEECLREQELADVRIGT